MEVIFKKFELFSLAVILLSIASVSLGVDLNQILSEIPAKDRLNFIKFHANKGYNLKYSYEPKYGETYDNDFSIKLYNYFAENNKILDETEKKKIQCKVCFPNGDCIDFDDPGNHPTMVKTKIECN